MESNSTVTTKKAQVFPKVIGKRYVVKVNGESVFTAETRKQAFAYIGQIALNESITDVRVVNETVTEKLIKAYKPQTQAITLVAADLGPSLSAE